MFSWKLKLLQLAFQKFNEIIDSSRAEADLAEANITEIERLISSANNKSDEATENLGDAQELAKEAASTAEKARDTANATQQVRSRLNKPRWCFIRIPGYLLYWWRLLRRYSKLFVSSW